MLRISAPTAHEVRAIEAEKPSYPECSIITHAAHEKELDVRYGRAAVDWACTLVAEAEQRTQQALERASCLTVRAERVLEQVEMCAEAVKARLDAVNRELDNVRAERRACGWLLEELRGIADSVVQREIERSRSSLVCVLSADNGRRE